MARTAATLPPAADHVLWFPQCSDCASWFLLALCAECGKILPWGVLSSTLWEFATADIFLLKIPACVYICRRNCSEIVSSFGNHSEKAYCWLASRLTLISQDRGLKEQRNCGAVYSMRLSGEEIHLSLVSSVCKSCFPSGAAWGPAHSASKWDQSYSVW